MEFDFQKLDSDEGGDFLFNDNGELFSNGILSTQEEIPPVVLEAKTIYLLLPKNVPVSRASRLQWLLDHLNCVITVPSASHFDWLSNEIEVISVVSKEPQFSNCTRFRVTSRTELAFLARAYKFVYCLDMSPSQSAIDICMGEILFDQVLNYFKTSITKICQEFCIPGSGIIFRPKIFLTVIVNTPFFMSPAQQVLVKGVELKSGNINNIIACVEEQFQLIEAKVANVAALAHEQMETQTAKNEAIVGALFDLPDNEKSVPKIPMVSPDANFVNMLRYSVLAISLLPDYCLSNIVVITDGVVAMPDSNIMESLLFQLHYDSTTVSFLKVGSAFHPHCNSGYVPYSDLLHFLANSTHGVMFELKDYQDYAGNVNVGNINMYQAKLLMWNFHSLVKYTHLQSEIAKWNSQDEIFRGLRIPCLLSKRQVDESINTSLMILLCRRMREGFSVDTITYMNGHLDITFCLQWKPSIYIFYKLSSQWPLIKGSNTYFEINITAPYEFLHDITCMIKKETKSTYRQAIIERFWIRLSNLSVGDKSLAQQLSLFQTTSVWYNLPESVRSGIPVFILNNNNDNTRTLSPSDRSCPKFADVWHPICQLDTSHWRKWFHTHKISLILKHDQQLPKHLHLANSAQRYQSVQCRQAATALYGLFTEWSTFILIDNNTYLKLLHKEKEKPPIWFCIVRLSSKLPCTVLQMGFYTTTPSSVRHNVVQSLKSDLLSLTYLASPVRSKENTCCVLLEKPLEKILIKYERIPSDFTTVIFPDGTQPPHNSLPAPHLLTGSLFTTLSRYLYHKRWIWGSSYVGTTRLSDISLSRILSTLTKMRIEEGFHFAYSSSGILTMVMELWMENTSCVVQYVIFPPNFGDTNVNILDNNSSSEDDIEGDDYEVEMQLVTEVWIEPQYGRVQTTNPRISYMNNKQYYEIADVISQKDLRCIHSLLTIEHLSLMCQEQDKNRSFNLRSPSVDYNNSNSKLYFRKNSKYSMSGSPIPEPRSSWYPIISPRIEHIPFNFDAISILPMCQQTELLFSLFVEGSSKTCSMKSDFEKSNRLLLDNFHSHLTLLHDYELDLTREDSEKFTKHIISRNRNKHSNPCPVTDNGCKSSFRNPRDSECSTSQWRCMLKGVSITHVVLTFIPSTLADLKFLLNIDADKSSTVNEPLEKVERPSSTSSDLSDVPINNSNTLLLPVYVFDCPLAVLMNTFIHNRNEVLMTSKDIYEDHRFKFADYVHQESIKFKDNISQSSPEPRNEDTNISDNKNSAKAHTSTLVLTHSKSFVISLFVALHHGAYIHSSDVQSAMDQCEDNILEIDITNYILTVCGHVKHSKEDKVAVSYLHQATPCSELKPLHNLIKENFFNIVNIGFNPIPTYREFYFFRNVTSTKKCAKQVDSDDETCPLTPGFSDLKSDTLLGGVDSPPIFQRFESMASASSDIIGVNISPLFLHLICTIRYNNGGVSNTSVRVLPTCLGELIQNLEQSVESFDRNKIKITLDVFCLTLPNKIQNVITDYSTQGMRTTSFCSDGIPPSIGSVASDNSYLSDPNEIEPLMNLPEYQRKAIIFLREEIKWLLKDEITTSLLDINPVTSNTLNFVTNHILNSASRSSCDLVKINLNFVYGTNESHEKFVEEFMKMSIPCYKLCKLEDYYYLVKDNTFKERDSITAYGNTSNSSSYHDTTSECMLSLSKKEMDFTEKFKDDIASQQSDISSVNESVLGTDGGYDEDVSEDYEDYDWLININHKRPNLPNFWLILKVEQDVTIYFHCRYLELPTMHVGVYLSIQRTVQEAIKALCKRVNQSLLLQSLYETKCCDSLLEPDDYKEWHSERSLSPASRTSSYLRLKSMEETNDEIEMTSSTSLSDSCFGFKNGEFSCPVVWETHFILHPRLKTGPGKSIISRGILALKNILDKFSVSNRSNMFVYRDNENNVFYLRLQENSHISYKLSAMRPNEFENAIVSRSPSIASLPLGQNKSSLGQSETSISSAVSGELRPRVRSFGERESNFPHEDTLTLKVHGITEAGKDVQCDLVQVLQNRLDDAVLEFLSIMLARNSMCPLTPEDVHFIQKPFRPAEVIIKLTIEDFALIWIDSFIHYLKQNLHQFLNIPKYTDAKSHYHFKDYLEHDQSSNMVDDDNIFIFNQSQNPSSGNRGIACIALALINKSANTLSERIDCFVKVFDSKTYEKMISSHIIHETDPLPKVYLEFRIWKQGRVNIDNLTLKLKQAVCQATWDIVTEYVLLTDPLCVTDENAETSNLLPVAIDYSSDLTKELEFNIVIKGNKDINVINGNTNSGSRKKETFSPAKKKARFVIPPKRKTSRSITFDGVSFPPDQTNVDISSNIPVIQLTPLETGYEGILSETYSKNLPAWLEYGASLFTPSVKKHRVILGSRHLPYITIRELLNLIEDSARAFHAVPLSSLKVDAQYKYKVYQPSNSVQKSIIVSRNFQQWKASTCFHDDSSYCEVILPQSLKHSQKFVPLIHQNKFVPRQKLLWLSVESDYIIIYSYNWTKDKIEKLINYTSKLGQWLSVRSSFLNSATGQKLGIFHNQCISRKSFINSTNPYTIAIGHTESMKELPKDISRRTNSNFAKTLDVFRDSFCQVRFGSSDTVVSFTIEMHQIKLAEEKSKEEMKKLHAMYQSRTSSATVPQIFLLLQNSRIVHYCHTPLLYLPKWRLKSAATRDHSLCPSQEVQVADKDALLEKDSWHTDLCYVFFSEYRRYLQTLGFMPLQFDNNQKPGIWLKENCSYKSVFYIQKTILGGILLFTAEFVEPFFTTKLFAIECNRLQNISSRASINRFTLSFLDECDRVRICMHLHSFTYDFHLRTIYKYISSNTGAYKLCDNYDVNHFLDDFMKYYNKAPNFARNLIHSDTMTIKNLITEGKQLYDYLLTNYEQYNFKILTMERGDDENEQILVQITTTSQVSYKDTQDRQHTDDFELTVVIHNLCVPYSPTDNILHLKFYLILTSKRDIYPKSEIEQTLGKFRTVSSTARSLSALERGSSEETKAVLTSDTECELTSSDEHIFFSENATQSESETNSSHHSSINHREICQESVNYLGYYSSHEQFMQQLIQDKAITTQIRIKEMVSRGMIHCRTNLLWNKLTTLQETVPLTYNEFIELKSLANFEHLCDVYPNLSQLLNQPLPWYEGLSRLLLVKYSEYKRMFVSPDGNIQHYVIIHPNYFGAFMLLSLDFHTARGDLYAVYRHPQKHEDPDLYLAYRKELLDGFVNCISFYLWSGLI